MKEYPKFLSEEQTKRYLQDFKSGKTEVKNILVKHNLKLIDQIITDNFNNTPYSYNVIFSLGLTGLSRAINTYTEQNDNFTSYASKCITANINAFLKAFPQTSLQDKGQRFAKAVINELDLKVKNEQLPRLTNYIIDQFELYNNKTTKEILKLKFGFYEKPLPEYKIAKKLNIEIYVVIAAIMKYKEQIINYAAKLEVSSSIKKEPVKQEPKVLRQKEVASKPQPIDKPTEKRKPIEATTIYEHAAYYGLSRQETDELLAKCNNVRINLIKKLYGEDFCTLQDIPARDQHYIKTEIRKIFVLKMTGQKVYERKIKLLEERVPNASFEQIKAYVASFSSGNRELFTQKYGEDLKQRNKLDEKSEQKINNLISKMIRDFDRNKTEFQARGPQTETLYTFLFYYGLTKEEVDRKYPLLPKDIQTQIKKLYGEDFCTLQKMNRNYQMNIRFAIKEAFGVSKPSDKKKGKPCKTLLERLPETNIETIKEIISTYSTEFQNLLHQKFGENLNEWHRLDYIDEARINNILTKIKKDIAKRNVEQPKPTPKPERVKPAVSFELYLRRKGIPSEEVMRRYNALKPQEKETIKILFGEDLSSYDSTNVDEKTMQKFYYIVSKLKEASKLPKPNESIYVTFSRYPKEEVDKALLSLAPETRELVYIYHGYDLENPVYVKIQNKIKNTVTKIIYPRISNLLQKPEPIKKPEEPALNINELLNLAHVLASKDLTNSFTNKELIIFALRVGMVEDGPYTIDKVSSFFDLTEDQINAITLKVMSKFKDNFNEIFDIIMSSLYNQKPKELKGTQIKPISREE